MHGKVKVVLREGRFYVESTKPAVLQQLLKDELIAAARVDDSNNKLDGAAAGGAGNELARLEAERAAQTAAGYTRDEKTGFLRANEPKERDSIAAALRNDSLEVCLCMLVVLCENILCQWREGITVGCGTKIGSPRT